MDMPHPHTSSDKSLEQRLSECVQNLTRRKNLTIVCDKEGLESIFVPFNSPNGGDKNSPNRSNEASPNLHHERSLKCRLTNEKMGPRQGAVCKHRQQRHTSKGPMKVYPADASNFKALVHEHTSQRATTPPTDAIAQQTTPHTPHSTRSAPSSQGFASQPSSPTTPCSFVNGSTSYPSSPHQSCHNGSLYLPYTKHSPHPNTYPNAPDSFELHPEHSPHLRTHLNVQPLWCEVNQTFNPNLNAHPSQSANIPPYASEPCLGASIQAYDAPQDDDQQQGINTARFTTVLSLKRFLFSDDDAACNPTCS